MIAERILLDLGVKYFFLAHLPFGSLVLTNSFSSNVSFWIEGEIRRGEEAGWLYVFPRAVRGTGWVVPMGRNDWGDHSLTATCMHKSSEKNRSAIIAVLPLQIFGVDVESCSVYSA